VPTCKPAAKKSLRSAFYAEKPGTDISSSRPFILNLYAADSYTIRKITPAGVVSAFCGKAGASGDSDGGGGKARFGVPAGVAVDAAGNVYVADIYTIRKITPSGLASTLAGTAQHAGAVNNAGIKARFGDQPKGIAVDKLGDVYVADAANSVIRRITPSGLVSTLAGFPGQSGGADGDSTNARFYHPQGIAVDSAGNVYVADTANNTIRKIAPTGVVGTLAGTAGQSGNADGVGSTALFNHPEALTMDVLGNLYVADTGNQTIRKVTPNGEVSTLTGSTSKTGMFSLTQ